MDILVKSPLVIIASVSPQNDGRIDVLTKGLASSLLRTLFGGRIIVLRNKKIPLFKTPRANVEERFIKGEVWDDTSHHLKIRRRKIMIECARSIFVDPEQWVIFIDPASLALRNIDHLLPADSADEFPASSGDMYLLRNQNPPSCFGFWAIRGRFFSALMETWNAHSTEDIWAGDREEFRNLMRSVEALGLGIKYFEAGEVIHPNSMAMDWQAIVSSAIVTVPLWDLNMQLSLLHPLYMGRFVGDDSGLIMNIIEA